MSRLHIESPEAFHGQPTKDPTTPDLRGLAARHVEPTRSDDRAVDWQRKATDLSELLSAALGEIDRLRLRLSETNDLLGSALAALDKPRMSRDCRTCAHEYGRHSCRVEYVSVVAEWIAFIDARGLLGGSGEVLADTPTNCPGWEQNDRAATKEVK